ncbi:hypothetical protein M885DRAFT_579804 [Pelagophyceae sp. CCMP2097]|nr:hypothetical protein M885DRAFT_579804 [Pelagophyceae sp. CCMP2097]
MLRRWVVVGLLAAGPARRATAGNSTNHCERLSPHARRPRTACANFVIISQQRSGSRYVVDKLSTHPETIVGGELFMGGWMDVEDLARAAELHQPLDALKKTHVAPNYLDSVRKAHIKANYDARCCRHTKHVGFKWMTNQDPPPRHREVHAPMLEYLAAGKTKIIYLWRRNILRQVISQRVNKIPGNNVPAHIRLGNGKNISTVQMAAYGDVKVALPSSPCELAEAFRKKLGDRRTVRGFYSKLEHTTVYYEDLIGASPLHDAAWARVLEFIGVPPTVPPYRFAPSENVILHGDKPIFASVSNSEEARKAYLTLCAAPAKAAAPVDAAGCAEVAAVDTLGSVHYLKRSRAKQGTAPWSDADCKHKNTRSFHTLTHPDSTLSRVSAGPRPAAGSVW